ncbi:MAG: leucyl/phenylalanyl-tRNA--protein transferase [Gammaproteobacteria bacterium]|nr:leucyl/phenylalanyl-tRNA--protein transferase [Gammaproteobacteria bacterium]
MRYPVLLDPYVRTNRFPPVARALTEPNGLLAVGGCLDPAWLLEAYRDGIFPWFSPGQPIMWWSPDPRMVLFPERLKVSRSLDKLIRQGVYTVTLDQAFAQVIRACSEPRSADGGTWITEDMIEAYTCLHELGHAHSVEAWFDGDLAGGLYGVALGRVFFGESMFFRRRDASKVAFVHLVRQLRRWGFSVIDCQMNTEHLRRFGAAEIPRLEFVDLLRDGAREASRILWRFDPDGPPLSVAD